MSEELPSNPNLPPKQSGKIKFLLIALGPIPVGLLIFTAKAFLKSNPGQNGLASELVMMGFFTFICSLIGSIGLCGGFGQSSGPKAWLGGIVLGIALFIVDVLIIFFVGCAIIAGH
jgi:hypothetical protein